MEDSIFAEKYAREEGFLQRLDTKFKMLAMFGFIIILSTSRSLELIVFANLLVLALARASKIGLRFFILRVWLFIPLFSGIIAFPSIFGQGIKGAALFVLRVAASVSFVTLLTLTTKWSDMLKALAAFRVPSAFILVLGMTYRYIFLFVRIAEDMHYARKSRTIKQGMREGQDWMASRIGVLFRKSLKMSEDVHSAMISRGYRGEAR